METLLLFGFPALRPSYQGGVTDPVTPF